MRIFLKHSWLLFAIIIGLPLTVQAAGFTPADKDQSVEILGVFYSAFDLDNWSFGGFTALGQMFEFYNQFILQIGLLFLMYTIMVGLARTAMTGKFLGQRGNLWTPLRVIFGLALMLPTGKGYILLQTVFMFVVQSGVGMADTVWGTAKDLLNGESIYSSSSVADAAAAERVKQNENIDVARKTANALIKGLACVQLKNYEGGKVDTLQFNPDYTLGGQAYNAVAEKDLGGITVLKSTDFDGNLNLSSPWSNETNSMLNIFAEVDGSGDSANPDWRWFTYNISIDDNPVNNTIMFGMFKQSDGIYTVADPDCGKIPSGTVNEHVDVYTDFLNSTKEVVTWAVNAYENAKEEPDLNITLQLADDSPNMDKLRDAMICFANRLQYGTSTCPGEPSDGGGSSSPVAEDDTSASWYTAGFYYSKLARGGLPGGAGGEAVTLPPKNPVPAVNLDTSYPANDGNVKSIASKIANALVNQVRAEGTVLTSDNPLDDIYDDVSGYAAEFTSGDHSRWINIISEVIRSIVSSRIIVDMSSIYSASGDPFKEITRNGAGLLWGSFALIVICIPIFYAISVGSNVCSGDQPVGGAIDSTLRYLALVTSALSATMFAEGALLAVFLPLIPVVIWVVAIIGWLMAVLEAMVAAPIVALAVMWPDAQNEVFGRGEPALMLLLNIFLRPALLVIGLLIAMYVCQIAFSLAGLVLVIAANIQAPVIRMEGLLGWIPVGFMFGFVLLMLAQKSFGLIHEVPDKVLTWIGGQVVPWGGADEAVGALRSGVQQSGGGPGSMGKGAGNIKRSDNYGAGGGG